MDMELQTQITLSGQEYGQGLSILYEFMEVVLPPWGQTRSTNKEQLTAVMLQLTQMVFERHLTVYQVYLSVKVRGT